MQKIHYSPRTMIRVNTNELFFLKKYTTEDTAAYANIKRNAGISRDTVNKILDEGRTELRTAIKLRDFIKLLSASEEFSHLNN